MVFLLFGEMNIETRKGRQAAPIQTQLARAASGDSSAQREATKADRDALRQERRTAVAKQMASGIHPDSLLPIEPHVTTLMSGSKATVYRRALTDPTFPKLIRLSSRCTRIRAGDLLDWLKRQGAE